MPNPRNIGSGKRTIQFKVSLKKDETTFVEDVVQVVRNFDKGVRAEMLNWAADEVTKRARRIIQEGKAEANTPEDNPRSMGLEDAFRVDYDQGKEVDRMVVTAGVNRSGQIIPYAYLHNKPQGSTTTIVPVTAMYLRFYWFRHEEFMTARHVERPGIAYFDRAINEVRRLWPKELAKVIRMFNQQGLLNIDPQTGAKLRGNSSKLTAKMRRDATAGR